MIPDLRDDFLENGRDYDDLDEHALAIDPPRGGWKTFARLLSSRHGGQWWPNRIGLTWVFGRQVTYCIDRDSVRHVAGARKSLAPILPKAPGWTPGKLARQVLKYIDCPQTRWANCELLLPEKHGYASCTPGQYSNMSLFDISGCYWEIFSRLPSMRVVFHTQSKRVQFIRTEDGSMARHAQIVQALAPHKRVRNSVVGMMVGGPAEVAFFSHGTRYWLKLDPPQNFPAGAVVIRTAYELTAQASEECDSVLSMVDSICTPSFDPPIVWQLAGLKVRRLAHGDADIIRIGVYAVGDRISAGYWCHDRERVYTPPPPVPEYHIGVWL